MKIAAQKNDQTAWPSILLVSEWPPLEEGVGVSASIVLHRLFCGYRGELAYASLSTVPDGYSLPSRVREHLYRIPAFPELSGRLYRITVWANHLLRPIFVRQLRKAVRAMQTDIIFAAPIHFGCLFRAAVELCRRDDIPLASYFMDDWASTLQRRWLYPKTRCIHWQARAIAASALVYTNGPGMQEEYLQGYGKESRILTNVVKTADFSLNVSRQHSTPNDIATIVYTGTIYAAQHDAIENLIKALDILNRSKEICHLVLYSDRSPEILALWGWTRPYVLAHPAVGYAQIPDVLTQADILFLPLSFRPEQAFVVRTAAPGKFPEYAASGRPILIHAPSYADIALLSRQRGVGNLVDTPDPQLLAQAILRILTDRHYSAELGQQSLEVARRYYDQTSVQNRLYDELAQIAAKK